MQEIGQDTAVEVFDVKLVDLRWAYVVNDSYYVRGVITSYTA